MNILTKYAEEKKEGSEVQVSRVERNYANIICMLSWHVSALSIRYKLVGPASFASSRFPSR